MPPSRRRELGRFGLVLCTSILLGAVLAAGQSIVFNPGGSPAASIPGPVDVASGEYDANTTPPALDIGGSWLRIGDADAPTSQSNGLGIKFADMGTSHGTLYYNPGSEEFVLCESSGNSVLTCDGGSETLRVNVDTGDVTVPNGKLGIGYSNPQNALEVKGTSVFNSSSGLTAFTSTGSHSWTVPDNVNSVEVLVVGGGGGGGGGYYGGGGGGGGVVYHDNHSVTPGESISITVGAGGAGGVDENDPGDNGGNSSFDNLVARGGGGGGGRDSHRGGKDGGSGGGASYPGNNGGAALQPGTNSDVAGVVEWGNPGGDAGSSEYGAGGGGANETGNSGSGCDPCGSAPTYGINHSTQKGVNLKDVFGSEYGDNGAYGGGGGGGTRQFNNWATPFGGGGRGGESSNHNGAGVSPEAGVDGAGGGGGGAGDSTDFQTGADGGDGIVIVKWGGNAARVEGNLEVTGTITKGSGTFDIPYPDPEKAEEGYRLRHSFVESPTAGDNIYRYTVNVTDGSRALDLPDYFKDLNKNPQTWISPVNHFGDAYATVTHNGSKLEITADTDGMYNVLVIGTRKDDVAQENWNPRGVEYQK